MQKGEQVQREPRPVGGHLAVRMEPDAAYHPFLPPLRAFWLVSGVRGDAGVDAACTCPSYTQGNRLGG